MMAGRPTLYTAEIDDEVCRRLSSGESLRAICESKDMPHESTVRSWVVRDQPEGFAKRYLLARDIGLDCKADEFLAVASTPLRAEIVTIGPKGKEVKIVDAVDRSRLHADSLKWYLSKLAPKRYGDKLALEHSGSLTISERLIAARKRTGK